MKQLFLLLVFSGIIYGGYLYYRQSKVLGTRTSSPVETQSKLLITHTSDKLGDILSVLGSETQNVVSSGQELLSTATDGQSDPIINRAVVNLQSQVKDLPKETVDKIKYEFCKGIVNDYEGTKQ